MGICAASPIACSASQGPWRVIASEAWADPATGHALNADESLNTNVGVWLRAPSFSAPSEIHTDRLDYLSETKGRSAPV
jgi:hypothetical protein